MAVDRETSARTCTCGKVTLDEPFIGLDGVTMHCFDGTPCYVAPEVPERWVLVDILVDFILDVEERERERTDTCWPDLSDIYTGTINRLREAFDGA